MVRLVLLCAVILALSPAGAVSAQPAPAPLPDPGPALHPAGAVFLLALYAHDATADGLARAYGYGTGFFISPDGTALTASHVVYAAEHEPAKYRLLAVVGHEFYDTEVVCSSRLPYDPTMMGNREAVPLSRDVAEIKVVPTTAFNGRKSALYIIPHKGDPRVTWATAHMDELPVFPSLTIGGTVHIGEHVQVTGFGAISIIPERWTASGTVQETISASDGTPLFKVFSNDPAVPGDSGAPVLDDHNTVVGLWAWHYINHPRDGIAQGVAALRPACR